MEGLIQDGKIRGWGLCNDSAYGLTACTRTAKALGVTPPCSIQGDFSLIDRKSEENGVAEACSPYNENVGFMAYNALAGGMLTGKYMSIPAALDDTQRDRAMKSLDHPRGRMDTRGWGGTLYVGPYITINSVASETCQNLILSLSLLLLCMHAGFAIAQMRPKRQLQNTARLPRPIK
jgi:hypothetical protein